MPQHIQEKAGLSNTGVSPVYLYGAECPEVKPFFGDQTRYDGSTRTPRFYQGYHEGFDISLPEGTPLLPCRTVKMFTSFPGRYWLAIKFIFVTPLRTPVFPDTSTLNTNIFGSFPNSVSETG